MSSIHGLANQCGKARPRLLRQQLHDAEVVAHEVVAKRTEVGKDGGQRDGRPRQPSRGDAELSRRARAVRARSVHDQLPPENRYLMMIPIMLKPVFDVPLRLPVILDSPTRPR